MHHDHKEKLNKTTVLVFFLIYLECSSGLCKLMHEDMHRAQDGEHNRTDIFSAIFWRKDMATAP